MRRAAAKVRSTLRHVDEAIFGRPFAHFDEVLRREIVGHGETLLDVGCGIHSPAAKLRSSMRFTAGVDMHIPSLLGSRAAHSHHAYAQMNILSLGNAIAPASFDIVIAIDVIEHLTKEEGARFLRTLESVARRRVIIFTPNGFLPQHPTPDNPHQEHISGWTADEMKNFGYAVHGINGWRPLRGEYAEPRPPRWLTGRMALLSERWLESHPSSAFQILCVKDVSRS